MKYVINGNYLCKTVTGVQRYAFEITKELDKLIENAQYEVELLVPSDCDVNIDLKNIKVIRFGKNKKLIWEQILLPLYCAMQKAVCVCMSTVPPIVYSKKTIAVVHDASTLVNPEYYQKKYLIYSKIFCWSQKNRLRKIITVSNFSKSELEKYWIKGKSNIAVIENAADHVLKIVPDDSVLKKLNLSADEYYYSLSSLSPNKNFRWIMEVAKNNPNSKFVISGNFSNIYNNSDFQDVPLNVTFTGYVSDSEMVSLMNNCKAFVFPTLYEGFGITPLEALTLGKKILVSDIPVMREVYEESALYFNPLEFDYDIDSLYEDSVSIQNVIVDKYSWKKSAQKCADVFDSVASSI